MQLSKPSWLKVRLPTGERQKRYAAIKSRARALDLHTVCEEAQCPNIGECWGGGTATFMVMGSVCTRGCRFCAVNTSRAGGPLDPQEPRNVAAAIAEMDLDYVVLTSVDRDDLVDGGAGHFAACVQEIREATPQTLVEILIPDFQGETCHIDTVIDAKPAVVAHNLETIERLTPKVRDPRATYGQSLDVLAHIAGRGVPSKSSLMLGLGEHPEEVLRAMQDLRDVGVDFLTLGQYLRPSARHLAVDSYVSPQVFMEFEEAGRQMGFAYVASGPLIRSSYKAGEFYIRQILDRESVGNS